MFFQICGAVFAFAVFWGLANTTTIKWVCPPKFQQQKEAIVYGKTCYQFNINQIKTFSDAQNFCEENGGQLATIKSKVINKFIGDVLENYLNVHYKRVWIGLRYFGHENVYKWVDGSTLGQYNNLKQEQTRSNRDGLIAIDPHTRKWVNYNSYVNEWLNRNMFVCEYPATRLIPPPTSRPPTTQTQSGEITVDDCPYILDRDQYLKVFGDKCYMFEIDQLRPFEEADHFCQFGGGRLMIIKSVNEAKFIAKALHSIGGEHNVKAWIGLRFDVSRQNFYWVDGSLTRAVRIHYDSNPISDQCVVLDGKDGKGYFRDCDKTTFAFVCEFNPTRLRTTSPTPAIPKFPTTADAGFTTDKSCIESGNGDTRVLYSKGKCYNFRLDDKVTFQQAEKNCESLSSRLVSITTNEISLLLTHHIQVDLNRINSGEHYWIGLAYNPTATPEGYYWTDGTPLGFSNFAYGKQYECVAIDSRNGRWVEAECHTIHVFDKMKLGYICEHEPKVVTTHPTISTSTIGSTKIKTTTSTTKTTTIPTTHITSTHTTSPVTTSTKTTTSTSTIPTTTTTTTTATTIEPTPTTVDLESKITKNDCPLQPKDKTTLQVFRNKCYFFKLDDRVTFNQAKKFCEIFSGKLVQIKSDKINSFLHYHIRYTFPRSFSGQRYWIGLSYNSTATPDGYYWVDGTPLAYNNFGREQQYECAAINGLTGHWDEAECHPQHALRMAKLGYICEFESKTITTHPTTKHTTMTSPRTHYPTPTTKHTTMTSPTTHYPTPTTKHTIMTSPTTHYPTPTTKHTTMTSPRTHYPTPTTKHTTMTSPTTHYPTPTTKHTTMTSPTTHYPTPTTKHTTMTSPTTYYPTPSTSPTTKHSTMTSPTTHYPTPTIPATKVQTTTTATPAFVTDITTPTAHSTKHSSKPTTTTLITFSSSATWMPPTKTTVQDKSPVTVPYTTIESTTTNTTSTITTISPSRATTTVLTTGKTDKTTTPNFTPIDTTSNGATNTSFISTITLSNTMTPLTTTTSRHNGTTTTTTTSRHNSTSIAPRTTTSTTPTNTFITHKRTTPNGTIVTKATNKTITPIITTANIRKSTTTAMLNTTATTSITTITPQSSSTSSTPKHHKPISEDDCTKLSNSTNPDSFQVFEGTNMCYFFALNDARTFSQAQEVCKNSFSGSLATVWTDKINLFLQYHLYITYSKTSYEAKYWIGLRYHSNEPVGYYWENGVSMDFENFANYDRRYECVAIRSLRGEWVEANCHATHKEPSQDKMGYICEFDPTAL